MAKRKLLFKMVVCLLVFVLLLGSVLYLALRPVSYNMEYYGESDDEYGFFAASRYYTRDDFLFTKNTNFDLPIVDYYYYKDGYAFSLRAETEEQYTEETQKINSRWEDALKVDFYSCEISAYKLISVRPDGAVMEYTCKDAIVLTVIAAVAALLSASIAAVYFVLYKKAKAQIKQAEE